jgi:hypothetical protein
VTDYFFLISWIVAIKSFTGVRFNPASTDVMIVDFGRFVFALDFLSLNCNHKIPLDLFKSCAEFLFQGHRFDQNIKRLVAIRITDV